MASVSSQAAAAVSAVLLPAPAFAETVDQRGKPVTIADVAGRALPSVVTVASTKVERVRPSSMPFGSDPLFRGFFGPGSQPPRDQREHGLGSGVIVASDGIVLTNNHVVDGADEIKVFTQDKREFTAKILGTDPKSDLAVLKLEGDTSRLTPISIGDSSSLRLGDVVLAIGNPFGVGETVTMGIVSAKGRANVGIAAYEDFIQTDAAINPGNSGGALVDMNGRLVGINTAILSRSGGNQGIGFAIPSNMAKPIMDSLVKTGRVVRGWLGIGIQDIDAELATALGLPSANGVLVSEVSAGGPAEKAGLKRGDVVLAVDGQSVSSTGELRNVVAAAGARVKVTMDLLRDGKRQSVTVELGEMPAEGEGTGGSSAGAPSNGSSSSLDGLTLQGLDAQTRRRYQVPASVTHGVVVTDIEPGSRAADQGLRVGDVVLEVNRHAVDGMRSFQGRYQASKDKVLLLVSRQGNTMYLVFSR